MLLCMHSCTNSVTNFWKMCFLPACNSICFSMSLAKPQLIFVSRFHSNFGCYWSHSCVAFFTSRINPPIFILDAMHSCINNTTCFLHFVHQYYIIILYSYIHVALICTKNGTKKLQSYRLNSANHSYQFLYTSLHKFCWCSYMPVLGMQLNPEFLGIVSFLRFIAVSYNFFLN